MSIFGDSPGVLPTLWAKAGRGPAWGCAPGRGERTTAAPLPWLPASPAWALALPRSRAWPGLGVTAPWRSGVWSQLGAGGLDAAGCSEGPGGITLSSARALQPLM